MSPERIGRRSRQLLAFASEIMDGYGRLLGYLNRSQLEGARRRTAG